MWEKEPARFHQLYDRAEEMAPCIIFIDELDAIALDRKFQELRGDVSEIVNALLTEMDGIVERDGVCTILLHQQDIFPGLSYKKQVRRRN